MALQSGRSGARPVSLMIKPVSGACSMRCRYCFYTDVMARRDTAVYPPMNTDMLESVVRRAFQYADGPVSFAFQGGEPTLIGLPFFQELVRLERSYNVRGLPVRNAVQTNGYELSDEMISFFAREGFLLGLSMDGTEEVHDAFRVDPAGEPTFRRVLKTAEQLKSAGVEFNVLCVVTDLAAQRPREVFEALAPYGHIQFIPCLDDLDGAPGPCSLTEAHYLTFLKTTFDLYYKAFMSGRYVSVRNFDNYIGIILGLPPENCAMNGRCGSYFLIESDGGVYPCDFYVLDEWKLGSICEASVARLMASDAMRRFQAQSRVLPERCAACRWRPLCRGGCRRNREPFTDGVPADNRFCESFRMLFEARYDRMKALAEKIQNEHTNRGKRG